MSDHPYNYDPDCGCPDCLWVRNEMEIERDPDFPEWLK